MTDMEKLENNIVEDAKVSPVVEPQNEVQMAKLPAEILNAVLEYLSTRPYKEVYQVVKAIQEKAEML